MLACICSLQMCWSEFRWAVSLFFSPVFFFSCFLWWAYFAAHFFFFFKKLFGQWKHMITKSTHIILHMLNTSNGSHQNVIDCTVVVNCYQMKGNWLPKTRILIIIVLCWVAVCCCYLFASMHRTYVCRTFEKSPLQLRPTSIEKEVFPAMAADACLFAMDLQGS